MTVRATGGRAARPTTVSAEPLRDALVNAKGTVARLYVHRGGLYIRLAGIQFKPLEEYFNLPLTHPNYNALFSLASMAAMSRRALRIRTVREIVSTEHGEVEHMVLDF